MQNFLRDYESALSKHTDAPEIFHRAAATGLLGAALSTKKNRCNVDGGAGHRWTNIWVVLVGDSGRSRKSTCVHMAHEVLARSEDCKDLRAPDDGSPEGFAKDLSRRENAMPGNSANLMMQGELTAFLAALTKDYMRNAKTMFMEWFEVPALYKRMLSKEEYTIIRPRVSLIGGIATELIPTVVLSEDWLGGLMSRCLLIHARCEREMRMPTTPSEETYKKLAGRLDDTLRCWRKTRVTWRKKNKGSAPMLLTYSSGAQKLRTKLEDKFRGVGGSENRNLLLQRADGHFHRLCAIEHVAARPDSLIIDEKDVHAAAVLWEHWMVGAPTLMERTFARSNADLEGDRLPRRIMRVLDEAGEEGLEEHLLMQQTILDSDRFQKAFASLEMAKLVERTVAEDGGQVRMRLLEKAK